MHTCDSYAIKQSDLNLDVRHGSQVASSSSSACKREAAGGGVAGTNQARVWLVMAHMQYTKWAPPECERGVYKSKADSRIECNPRQICDYCVYHLSPCLVLVCVSF